MIPRLRAGQRRLGTSRQTEDAGAAPALGAKHSPIGSYFWGGTRQHTATLHKPEEKLRTQWEFGGEGV